MFSFIIDLIVAINLKGGQKTVFGQIISGKLYNFAYYVLLC